MFEYSAILLALVVGLRTSNLMDHGLQPGENRASLTLGLQPVLILTFFTHNLGLLRCITGIRQPGPGQIFDGRAIGSCCSVLESWWRSILGLRSTGCKSLIQCSCRKSLVGSKRCVDLIKHQASVKGYIAFGVRGQAMLGTKGHNTQWLGVDIPNNRPG